MNVSYSKQFLFILALFLSPEVFAVGFEVLPTDKSLEYLGIIFGGSVGAITLSGDANPMLSKMFERFNFIIVTVGVSILSYIGIAAAINTAREGETMGKKFSLWVPLRAMLGMLLMVPSPGTGYSVVQMTVMWVVLNGIGAANVIWGVVLDQLALGLKATGKIEMPLNDADLSPLAEKILRASTCMQVLNNTPGLKLIQDYGKVKPFVTYDPPNSARKVPENNPTQISRDAIINVGVEGAPEAKDRDLCGSFKVSTEIMKGDISNGFNTNSLNTRLAVKVNAVMAMFSVLEPAAEELRVVRPLDALPQDPSPPMPSSGYIRQAINGYKSQLANILTGVNLPVGVSMGITEAPGSGSAISVSQGAQIGAAGGAAFGGPLGAGVGAGVGALGTYAAETWEKTNDRVPIASEQVAAFKRLGWIHAGSYYYAMSKSNVKIDLDAVTVMPTSDDKKLPEKSPDSEDSFDNASLKPNEQPPGWVGTDRLYLALSTPANRKLFWRAMERTQAFYAGEKIDVPNSLPELGSGKVSSGNGFIDQILGGISDSIRKPIIEKFQSGFVGKNEDPLISIGKFGWEIMLAGEISIFTAMIVAFGISTASSPASCMNPFAYSANQLLLQLFIVIFTFLVLMWSLGASMGVYIPLIPYIIFTGTAVGWMLAVIEAIVAAPLIALAMVQPGGEELGALKTPLMILANLFLRPTLMIFGFVIAGSFLRAILTMINFGFSRAVEESVIPTLFGIIPIIGIYAGFSIAMINEAFSLIYELPNKVIRYMGGQTESFSPGKLTEEAKKGGEKGTEAAAGAMKAGGGAAQGIAKGKMDQAKQMREEEIAKGGGGGGGNP